MMGDTGKRAIAAMWVLTFIAFLCVTVRLYTRKYIIRQIGLDDYVYTLSGGLLLFYTIFITIAAHYGFGSNITELEIGDAANAVLWELIGQTFIIIGMATTKASLGIFLLRIVVETWHKVAIYIACAELMGVSIWIAIMVWVQSTPVQSVYDPRVPSTHRINITNYSLVLGISCAVVDFFFAGFPWLFIWGLNMKFKEKMTIAGSMSLGVIAGICGSIRTVEILGLSTNNYTKDTVPLIVWSAAEAAVTMLCIVIPILRPLYRRLRRGAGKGSGRYYEYDRGIDEFGESGHGMDSLKSQHTQHDLENPALAARRKASKHPGTGVSTYCARADHESDEEILGDFHFGTPASEPSGITVTENVTVEVGSTQGTGRNNGGRQ